MKPVLGYVLRHMLEHMCGHMLWHMLRRNKFGQILFSSQQRKPFCSALRLGHQNSVLKPVLVRHVPEHVQMLKHVTGHVLNHLPARHILKHVPARQMPRSLGTNLST